jgi:hypothetical protein
MFYNNETDRGDICTQQRKCKSEGCYIKLFTMVINTSLTVSHYKHSFIFISKSGWRLPKCGTL